MYGSTNVYENISKQYDATLLDNRYHLKIGHIDKILVPKYQNKPQQPCCEKIYPMLYRYTSMFFHQFYEGG